MKGGDFAMLKVYRHRGQVGFIPWLGGACHKQQRAYAYHAGLCFHAGSCRILQQAASGKKYSPASEHSDDHPCNVVPHHAATNRRDIGKHHPRRDQKEHVAAHSSQQGEPRQKKRNAASVRVNDPLPFNLI